MPIQKFVQIAGAGKDLFALDEFGYVYRYQPRKALEDKPAKWVLLDGQDAKLTKPSFRRREP